MVISFLTPFEILERAILDKEIQEVAKAAGREFEASPWIARWREYVGETMGCRQAVTSQGLTLEPVDDDEEVDGLEDIVLETGSNGLKEMDEACLVPAVLDAIDDNIGDPDGMRTAVKAVMRDVKAWWRIPGWVGDPHVFRTEKDHLDRRAEAIPDPPEEVAARAIRERAAQRPTDMDIRH